MNRRPSGIFLSILKTAWRTLGRHRMRTALTMLGISIGIAAVIVMVSIGEGAKQEVLQRLDSMGTNVLFIEAGNRALQGVITPRDTMMYDDVVAVRRECPAVIRACPHVDFRDQVSHENQNWNTRVSGVDLDYSYIRRWNTTKGDFFTDRDIAAIARVAVLGKTVADRLFPAGRDPVGETIRIRGFPFRVLGVLEAKGSSVTGSDQDDIVLIPWTTSQRKMKGIRYIDDMFVSVRSREMIGAAKQQITELMRQRHGLRLDQPDDFSIRDFTELAGRVNDTNDILALLLGTVASLALLIGGINTMNIMLVTVTERTREIGIRMAIGAHERHVRLQFLAEAVVLTLIGGLFGVALGIFSAAVISGLLQWPTIISKLAIGGGIVVSALVGLVFGYFPAHKAASLDPIEALRYE